MARITAVARQYLRPGNHTRVRHTCSVEGCGYRPINRVYLNTATLQTQTQLLCPVHVVTYLDVPTSNRHVKAINRRYLDGNDFPAAYGADRS